MPGEVCPLWMETEMQAKQSGFKRIAAAAALVALAPLAAHATNNTGILTPGLTTGASQFLLGIDVEATGAASENLLGVITMAVTGITRSGNTLTSASFATSGLNIERFSLFGGTKSVSLSDIKFNFSTKSLIADVAGKPDFELFKAASVAGSLVAGTFIYTATDLKLTSAGATYLADKLGVSSLLKPTLAGINWGTLVVKAPIPEPSTYALMGLGLVGAGWVARRRQQRTTH